MNDLMRRASPERKPLRYTGLGEANHTTGVTSILVRLSSLHHFVWDASL
jgi:hypothetical protein